MQLTFVLDDDKLICQVTYVLVDRALDLLQIRPERPRPASLGKLPIATCEHMIVDGRTRSLVPYPLSPTRLGRGSVQCVVLREARLPPPSRKHT